MELDELKPTGYFSEFSWVSDEDEEAETTFAVERDDILAAPPKEHVPAADMATMAVLERHGATRS